MLTLFTLGRLELRNGEQDAREIRRKPLALLAYVARRAPRTADRRELAELLWGGTTDDALARKSLRQALSELRVVLGDRLQSEGDTIALAPDDPSFLTVDAALFEDDVRASRWSEAIAHWRGDFLHDLDDLGDATWRAWLEGERAALRRKLSVAFDRLIAERGRHADWSVCVQLAERWRAALPDDERACVALVTALRSAGRNADAVSRWAECVRERRDHYGAEPSADLVRLGKSLEMEPVDLPQLAPGARAFMTPDLVGRGQAFATLHDAWRRTRADTGAGRAVVILGDEGLGKSRLCHEFTRQVRNERPRATVIEAVAFESQRTRPYSTLAAIGEQLAEVPGLSGAPGEVLASLARIAPVLNDRFRNLPVDGRDLPDLAQAFRRALGDAASETPIVVFVDDAPAGDDASQVVLGEVLRRPPPGVMLLLTGRPGAPQSPLGADLRRSGPHTVVVQLEPLTSDEGLAALASMAPLAETDAADLAIRLHKQSGGNPGQLLLLFSHLADRGVLAPDAEGVWRLTRALEEGDLSLPSAAREAVRARVERLSTGARRVADAAAVVGPRSDAELLQQAAALEADTFREALGELIVSRFLHETPANPPEFGFASEATRSIVYALIAPDRRREMHERVYRTLRRRERPAGVKDDMLARHRRAAREGRWSINRRRWIATGLVAVALISGTFVVQRTGGARVEVGSPVLLADVRNQGGDTLFNRALYTAATIALRDSRHVVVFPRARVLETLRLMERPGADSLLDESLVREVALREHIRRVLAISVARFDSSYVLTARLIDPQSGEDVAGARETAATPDGMILALDRLISRVRRSLGETRAIDTRNPPLPRVTTSSLDALRVYADGLRAWTRRDYSAAHDAYSRAIALDSGFALAHAGLADYFHFVVRNVTEARASLARAQANANGLSERELLDLRIRAARINGPESEEARLGAVLARQYPDRDTWYNLGTVLMRQQRCPEAIPALRRAVQYDTAFTNAYINLATCYQSQGDYDAALREYALAQRSDSQSLFRSNLNWEWGHALLRAGEIAAAESVFRKMAERPTPQDRMMGWRSLSYLAMYRGSFAKAMTYVDSARVQAALASAPLSEYRAGILRAEMALTAGDTIGAAAALRRVSQIEPTLATEPFFLRLAVHAYARAGLIQRARQARGRAAAVASPALASHREELALMDGIILAAERRWRRALEKLDEVRDTTNSVWPSAIRADAYSALGITDSALAAARVLADHMRLGVETQDEWQRGLLRVGRLLERQGDSAAAATAYQAYLARFSEGDTALPDIREARRALDRIGPGDRPATKRVSVPKR